ncbi:hypothetical protein SPONN_20 [uncultured Candidatus Thioglobus sp.]|nr:hypothetical protein SPONN_20 [uncultured Candidatus Thioglobus sp.]
MKQSEEDKQSATVLVEPELSEQEQVLNNDITDMQQESEL